MNQSDLEYYRSELKRINALASVYPLSIVVSSDTGKTKHLGVNKESIQALKELFEAIEQVNYDERVNQINPDKE